MTSLKFAAVGPDLPLDLLSGAPGFAGHLSWNIDREFPQAAQWIETRFPLWAFSIVEDWADGAFDHLDAVVFSRGDDPAQRLYYYLTELRRGKKIAGPEPMIFDLALAPRQTSVAHTAAAVRALADRLGLNDAAIAEGIAQTNARRTSELSANTPRTCVLAGTHPPDRRLHDAIAAAGWTAQGHTLAERWADPGPIVRANEQDPALAIARQLHDRPDAQRGFADPAARLIDRARGAGAVVLWYAEQEEGAVWHLPAVRAALDREGIPHLSLTRRSWRADDGAAEEIAAFLRGLGV